MTGLLNPTAALPHYIGLSSPKTAQIHRKKKQTQPLGRGIEGHTIVEEHRGQNIAVAISGKYHELQ